MMRIDQNQMLESSWWRRVAVGLNPFAPFGEKEAHYQAYKYHGLHSSHLFSCLAILVSTVIFATIWWNDQYLEGTIFPQVLGPSLGPDLGPNPSPSASTSTSPSLSLSPSPNPDPNP